MTNQHKKVATMNSEEYFQMAKIGMSIALGGVLLYVVLLNFVLFGIAGVALLGLVLLNWSWIKRVTVRTE